MDDNNVKMANIPYIAHEGTVTHLVSIIKGLIIALCVVVFLMVASNLAWLYVYNQYDYADNETVTVDSEDGNASYIGNDGDIINGTDSSQTDKN